MLARLAPGLAAILASPRAALLADLRAGLSVAAVALPAAVAFAGLMNLPPEAGLHASILPMAAYALFGPSRRLVVAADTATCVLVAGSLTAMGLVEPEMRAGFAAVLGLLAGLLCLAAGLLRLGAMADFLSWPILVGFLNGVALDLVVSQVPRMLGVTVDAPDAVQRAIGIIAALPGTHAPTLLLSAVVLALVLGLRRLAPSVPAAFVACAAAIALSAALDLPAIGVAVLGAMPAALPGFALPDVPLAALFAQRFPLAEHAMGIALISFASFMIPARAFAARRGETTDADREAVSLGLCHAVAGAAQGFPVSASSTRTAVAEAAGSQGPACALVAAGAMAVAMATLSTPLAFLPRGAMAALLVQAALSLLDAAALRALWRFDRGEAALAVVATLGVLVAGPLNAVLISVALAILRFIRITARPSAEVLGRVPGLSGFHGIMRNPEARVEPGLVLFRFNAPLVFFNAPAFMRTALAAGEAPGTRWFVLDLYPITQIDSTGLAALLQVRRQLAARGVHVAFAGRLSEALAFLQAQGLRDPELAARFFPTLRAALRAYRAALSDGAALRQAVDTGFDTATALHKLGHESTAPSQHRDLRDPH